jgi:hypothetical protein
MTGAEEVSIDHAHLAFVWNRTLKAKFSADKQICLYFNHTE